MGGKTLAVERALSCLLHGNVALLLRDGTGVKERAAVILFMRCKRKSRVSFVTMIG